MAKESNEPSARDDAEQQPESGYPGGRMSTKPSAHSALEDREKVEAGSEAEFDSTKRRPGSGSGQPS